MPFGLDLKSVIVGIVFAMWVLPWILGMFARGKASTQKTTATH
jgi:hypothetical protein